MQSNHHHRESAVSFHKSGGHSHDGVNSSRIDFSSYSDAELAPLVAKIKKKIKSGGDSGDSEKVTLENQPVDDLIPTGAPLEVTLTSGYNDAASGWGDNTGWIKASWTVYTVPGELDGDVIAEGDDDDDSDLIGVGYMEGDGTTPEDDTDVTTPVLNEIQSAEAINEYQVSYWNIVFEPGTGDDPHAATTEHRKFIRTDEREVLIAPVPLGKTFHVRVRGISGNGKHSDPATNDSTSHILVGSVSETPAAPSGLSAVSLGADSIMLTWTESTHPLVVNGGNYRVQCNTSADFTSPLFARTVGGESTTFTGLSQGTDYFFRVKAKTKTGVLSDWSTTLGPITTDTLGPIDVSDGIKPSIPSAPSVYGGPNYLYIKWDAVTNTNDPITYKVYVHTSTTMTDPTHLAVSVSGTSTMVKRLPATGAALAYGTNYYARVEAVDIDGTNGMSAASSATQLAQIGETDIGPNSITTGLIVAGTILGSDLAITTGTVDSTFQSSSYSSGSAGWKINSDGSAEFNNLAARGTIKAGGSASADAYVKLDASSGDGRIDIFSGKDYAGGNTPQPATIIGGNGTSLSGLVSGTKQVWTYISSPYFTGSGYASRPVYLEMMTDDDTSTKSHFFVHAQKMWDDARHEGLVSSYASHSINRTSSSYSEQGPITIDPVATTDPWGMDSGGNYIIMPRTGTYLVTYTMEFGTGTTGGSLGQGSKGLRDIRVKKLNADTTTVVKTYILDRRVLATINIGGWGYESGALSGSVAVDATAGQVLKFYVVNWMDDETSGSITGISNISVYRIDA